MKSLITEIESLKSIMVLVATGLERIQNVNEGYKELYLKVKRKLYTLGIESPNPYRDLWEWYGKWSNGDLPSYQSRRQYLTELFGPLIERLESAGGSTQNQPLRELTGWARVDRLMDKVRVTLASAKHPEDFQMVGLLCREALISLGQEVFNPNTHKTADGVSASTTDAKRMLEAYISSQLSGESNEAPRAHAKSSLNLALGLQHKRTADFRIAAMCSEATTSVVNLIAIVSGRRDPEAAE